MRPLAGLRVVDLADEKGELCGRVLSDWGAEVIRVEPPSGARSRRMHPFAPDGETSLYFAVRNAGKRGLALDLDDASGRASLHELLGVADVMIESHAPGFLTQRGLAPEALCERHPQLVVTSISDFGQTGPYRDYQGTDMVGFAMGGMMHRAGRVEKPPVVAPGALAYDTAGISAVYATLLAHWKRLLTGRGQHVDVSVYEATANLSDWAMPNYSAQPNVGQRAGTGIYSLYRCEDGFVRMIVLVTHHWHALREWIGSPEELCDPALDAFIPRLMKLDRIQHYAELAFADRAKIDVAREAQRRGIPATPLLAPGEVMANEHCAARQTFAKLEVTDGVTAMAPSGFLHIDGERMTPAGPPPRFDEHAGAAWSAPRSEAPRPPWPEISAADGFPLRGLRVLDFGVGAVGVEVGRLLAEWGADVVKVESQQAPDFIRIIMGGFMNPNFASSSRSKRGFGVDLKSPRGVELVTQLAAWADVAIENNGAGVMDRLGIGPGRLREINPRLVMFSSQLVGSAGPWRDWIGYGPSAHAVSGLQYLWNYPEDVESPAGSTNVYPDHFVGRLGAGVVMAGLIARTRTGHGLHADAAQFESVIALLGDRFAQESLAPGSVLPQGNAHPAAAPWGTYPCAGDDAWCVINVRDDTDWRALGEALGAPDWSGDSRFETTRGRLAERGALDAHLSEWTAARAPREVMETLQAHGVPAGMVQHAGDQLEDPHLAARGYHRPIFQPALGDIVLEGPAFHASDLPEPRVDPAPLLGEHTRQIARDVLGLDAAEIDALLEQGVLEEPPDA